MRRVLVFPAGVQGEKKTLKVVVGESATMETVREYKSLRHTGIVVSGVKARCNNTDSICAKFVASSMPP
jgi:hypothetical protein